jgi:hypothetical protein
MDLDETAKRCRVMWEKGRNYYTAFFAALSDVQDTLSSEEFDDWCFKSVGVSLNVALQASKVLRETDRLRVESQLKRAAQAKRDADKITKEAAKLDLLDIQEKQTATRLSMEKNLTAIHEQAAIKSMLKYDPQSAEVAEILSQLSNRQAETRIANGLNYLRLKELVKSGAEGQDPATGKKWKWEKWAEMAIGRPMRTIREAMQDAKKELLKNGGHPPLSGNPLNGNGNPPIEIDKIHHVQSLRIQIERPPG